MYQPSFNSVLVELERDEWGTGNDDSLLGADFMTGTIVAIGPTRPTQQYPFYDTDNPQEIELIDSLFSGAGQQILWNKGAEAGTEFEHEGKQYAFIYWWDIRGVKRPEGEIIPRQAETNEDIEATKRTLRRHGVDPDQVDISGGGDENGNFTGVK